MKKLSLLWLFFLPGLLHAYGRFYNPDTPRKVQGDFDDVFDELTHLRTSISTTTVVNVKNFGAKGDCTTNDITAIQAAIDSLPATGGQVFFPKSLKGCYLSGSEILIRDQLVTGKSGVYLNGENKYVSIHFTSTTGSGIKILGQHDNLIVENLDLNASNNSSGAAIISTNTGSATPLRDFEFRDVNIEGFAQGEIVWGNLNGKIIGGRQGGQGKNSGHGYSGIQLGQDVNHSGNGTQIENVYVSNYDIGLNTLFAEPVSLVGLNLFGGCSTGVYVGPTSILIEAGEINFDSGNDTAILNDGYFFHKSAFSSIGTQKVVTNNHRLFYTGHSLSRISIYESSAPTITPNIYSTVPFDTSVENTEGYFSTTTYSYIAPYPGYRVIDASLRYDIVHSTTVQIISYQYILAIYVNGIQQKQNLLWIANPGPDSISPGASLTIHDLEWLNKGDIVAIYYNQGEPGTTTLHGGSTNSTLTIYDP